MARFSPLFSGSSGNSIAVGNSESFVLIDAGVSAKRLTAALEQRGWDISRLAAVFITHEHRDHVTGLRVFASRHSVPVYATSGTALALENSGLIGNVRCEVCPVQGVEAGGVFVRSFRTMHDTVESCGYVIYTADGRRVAVATDTGCVTDAMRTAMTGCDLVYIESNHDVGMLQRGEYTYELKCRILSERGHLSNDACAAELTSLVGSGSARFYLGHISEENNTPQLAHDSSMRALTRLGLVNGRDFTLQVTPPEGLPVEIF